MLRLFVGWFSALNFSKPLFLSLRSAWLDYFVEIFKESAVVPSFFVSAHEVTQEPEDD